MKITGVILCMCIAAIVMVGGYYAVDIVKCQNLQADYRSTVQDIRQQARTNDLVKSLGGSNAEHEELDTELRELRLRQADLTLTSIYTECGEDAGRSAAMAAFDIGS